MRGRLAGKKFMNYINLYVDFLKKFLKPKRKLRVVFDCSNGVTSLVLKELFLKSNVKGQMSVVFINDKIDGNFPAHGPNPLIKGATKQLEKEVKKQKADLGIIFDGDGDRVFFLDNRGRWVDPNESAYILTQVFKPPYVAGIVSSWRIKNITSCDDVNLIYISRVGHYFFKKLMREKKASLGLEHSGHYYFKKFFYCDSGILAAIEVINFVSVLKTDFASWLDKLPNYYRSGELNFNIGHPMSKNYRNIETSDIQKLKILKKIEVRYKNKAIKIDKLDGITLEFKDWWFNIRPSNTEPFLRLNLETTSKKLLNQKLKEIKKSI